ncbi:gibberellin regulated protein 14-like protein [Tanacetum coccineum]
MYADQSKDIKMREIVSLQAMPVYKDEGDCQPSSNACVRSMLIMQPCTPRCIQNYRQAKVLDIKFLCSKDIKTTIQIHDHKLAKGTVKNSQDNKVPRREVMPHIASNEQEVASLLSSKETLLGPSLYATSPIPPKTLPSQPPVAEPPIPTPPVPKPPTTTPPVAKPRTATPSVAKPPTVAPPRNTKECYPPCVVRCKNHSRQNVCLRACVTCCNRCKCVPPGQSGNREVCGPCYVNMKTHAGKPKCP